MKQTIHHGLYFMVFILAALALDAALFGPAIN